MYLLQKHTFPNIRTQVQTMQTCIITNRYANREQENFIDNNADMYNLLQMA